MAIIKFPKAKPRFLSDEELPDLEVERRETIRNTITFLETEIRNRLQRMSVELERNVREGRDNMQAAIRLRTQKEAVGLLMAIARMREELPPFLEMDETHQLVRVNALGRSRKPPQ